MPSVNPSQTQRWRHVDLSFEVTWTWTVLNLIKGTCAVVCYGFCSFPMKKLSLSDGTWLYWFLDGNSEKAVTTHSSTLAWKIPWMEEPGRLQSMGSRRVRHDWETSLSLFTFMDWRRKWQPTPVLLRSLVGCRLWGRTELDTTVVT